MTRYERLADLTAKAGTPLGHSEWRDIDQDLIDQFADLTNDHQWLHVDRERAAAGPFGTTIAHGYLIVSLMADMVLRMLVVDEVDLIVNKGLDRLRFKAPVRCGERVRARVDLVTANQRVHGYTELTLGISLEIGDRADGAGTVAMTGQVRLLMHVADRSAVAIG